MRRDCRGSYTVEAAFAVPVFVFGVMAFIYLFKVLSFQIQLQSAMTEASKALSKQAYIESTTDNDSKKDLLGTIVVQSTISKYFSQQYKYKSICKKQFSCPYAEYLKKDGMIDLVVNYKVNIPVPLFHSKDIPIMQRIKTRGFIGTSYLLGSGGGGSDEEGDDYVYITETGTVYHETLKCSALNLKISECSIGDVVKKRNASGGKYRKCEKCFRNVNNCSQVYISEDGDRYHSTLNCSGLKRTIKRVRLGEVKGKMRACYRCGKKAA